MIAHTSRLSGSFFIGTNVKGSPAVIDSLLARTAVAACLHLPVSEVGEPREVKGVYTHDDGTKVIEKTFVFPLTFDNLKSLGAVDGRERLSYLAESLQQESILLEWDNDASLHYADGRPHEYLGTAHPLLEGEEPAAYTVNEDGSCFTFRDFTRKE